MPFIQVTLNQSQRYRVFAGAGNILSRAGVSVVTQVSPEHGAGWEISFEFWTREDAAAFFRHCAAAAEECEPGEAGEIGTLMAEDRAAPWLAGDDDA